MADLATVSAGSAERTSTMGAARTSRLGRLALASMLLTACQSGAHDPSAVNGPSGAGEGASTGQSAWPLVFSEDFADPSSLTRFAFSDPDAWRWNPADGVPSLELAGPSEYTPEHRSPRSIALVKDIRLGDFDLEVEALQTGREYGHRDLCLFLAFSSASRFHYVHIATTPDANAHNVFLVDGAPRRNLLPPRELGFDWGSGWHTLRLERRVSEGRVSVFADGASEPLLEIEDSTLGAGQVGFGSFDDTGRFARLRIWAPASEPGLAVPFER